MNMPLCLPAAVLACALTLSAAPRPQDPPPKAESAPAPRKQFIPMPIPKAIAQRRGDHEIKIDGALDDWPKATPIVLRDIRQVSGTAMAAYRGLNDISGQMYMTWDDKDLYVAAQILDEWHHGKKKSASLRLEIPSIDNVLLTFDPNRDTRGIGADPGRSEDRSFYIADLEEVDGKLILWDRLRGTKTLTPGAECRFDRREKEGVTIYEARIPWVEILPPGQKPQSGRVFDLQVELNDYDEYTDPLPQTRVGWNFGMGPTIRPGLWGSVMLLDSFDAKRDEFPAFPPPSKMTRGLGLTRREWVDLYVGIAKTKPGFSTVDTTDPAMAGGPERFKLLKDLDGYLEGFPRLDNLDFHHRIQRRMVRETAGMVQSGLPFYWDYAMRDLQRRVVAAPPAGVIRVFRLPQGGWYIRSDTANFTIDPCGIGIERIFLRGGIDFAILTRPAETTHRHDPLLIRMAAAKPKRTFFTHIEFHLPGAKPGSMSAAKPFEDYGMGGLKRITPIGLKRKDEKVTVSVGYLVEWQDGRTLVHAGLSMNQKLIKQLGVTPDVLILSALYGKDAPLIARDFGARFTLLDDVMVAEEFPDHFGGRVTIRDAWKLQNECKPRASLILAPGESVDIPKK